MKPPPLRRRFPRLSHRINVLTLILSPCVAWRCLRVERAMGIEPTAQAWEAWVLPLYDARWGPDSTPCNEWRKSPSSKKEGRLAAPFATYKRMNSRLEELIVCLELQSPSENSRKVRRGLGRVVAARAGGGRERRQLVEHVVHDELNLESRREFHADRGID